MSAVLIIVVGATIYFGFKRFPQAHPSENTSTIIDYDEPVDSLTQSQRDGKMLFLSKCASCHQIFKDGMTSALIGVESRWPDKKELFAFIRNPAVVTAKSAYARKLKEKSGLMMTAFTDITDQEIQAFLDYIKGQEKTKGVIP